MWESGSERWGCGCGRKWGKSKGKTRNTKLGLFTTNSSHTEALLTGASDRNRPASRGACPTEKAGERGRTTRAAVTASYCKTGS